MNDPEESLDPLPSIVNESDGPLNVARATRGRRNLYARLRRQMNSCRWSFWGLWACLFIGWAFYTLALPVAIDAYRAWIGWKRPLYDVPLGFPQRELFRTCEYLTVVWFFYFGASIGSFFNVLAGRLPYGKGVVFGGSKCPYCNNHLKFIHNLPILGWLWLRGKCGFCRLPISSRYLWMEVLVGSIFLLIAGRELFTGGMNLPRWEVSTYSGVLNTVFYPKWPIIIAYAQHAFFVAALTILIAVCFEKKTFPWMSWLLIAVLIVSLRFLDRSFEFVRWSDGLRLGQIEFAPTLSIAVTVGLGSIFGLGIGLATALRLPSQIVPNGKTLWTQAGVLVGAVLGWQAVVLLLPITFLLVKLICWCGFKKKPFVLVGFLALLVLLTLVHHMFWRQIASIILLASK